MVYVGSASSFMAFTFEISLFPHPAKVIAARTAKVTIEQIFISFKPLK